MTREQMIKLGNDVYGRGTYNVEVYAGYDKNTINHLETI